MSEQVKNLFKHKIPFHLRSNISDERGLCIYDTSLYRSVPITYQQPDINIYDSGDIYDKVKPFLNYLVSKHLTTKHEGYTYSSSLFEIGIIYYSEEDYREYKKLISVEVDVDDDLFIFGEPNFFEFDFYKIYSNSIVIDIEVYAWITEEVLGVESEESEVEYSEYSEEEEEEPPKVYKAYKEDQCVVCLEKEPEFLFMDCGHFCVCLECEEKKQFRICPLCKTRISFKVKF